MKKDDEEERECVILTFPPSPSQYTPPSAKFYRNQTTKQNKNKKIKEKEEEEEADKENKSSNFIAELVIILLWHFSLPS